MIGKKRVLGIIPARGGSKGLPRKNVLDLAGKPMIAWSIAAAADSQFIDRCIVSTDDEEIAAVARKHGCEVPFMRPAEHARDHSTTLDVALHALDELQGFDLVVILQPTSPLRSTHDIDQTIEAIVAHQAPSAVSVYEPAKSPYWSYRTNDDGRLVSLLDKELASRRRQELPAAYVLNGAVYVARVDWLRQNRRFVTDETVAHVMPAERSLDVDTAFDLKLVTFYMQQNRIENRNNTGQADNALAANA